VAAATAATRLRHCPHNLFNAMKEKTALLLFMLILYAGLILALVSPSSSEANETSVLAHHSHAAAAIDHG
jgi:hypothetical protein